jgi:AcrR family transcriptional regulator
MATRDSLLDVTARLYAEHGWRGTTTRRIAEAAGVNEVTIFRRFGSKEALLLESIEAASRDAHDYPLPDVPTDLVAELGAWARTHHKLISEKRGIIRTSLAEWEERPELAPVACHGAMAAFADVVRYLKVARERGMIGPGGSIEAASMMLLNTLFLDAMIRDVMLQSHPHSVDESLGLFVDLILRSLSAKEGE